ncbi:MAG: DMT family transporter, partial [Deltaproteobacteria bacterium]|nr:DMT family transporter [Deltaproteobacteria bacterium]
FFRRAEPIDPLLASAVRLALAALLMSPALPRARREGKLSPPTMRWAAVAGLFYAVHFGTWVASLRMTSVTASVTLVTATPLLLAVIGWLAGRDAPHARLWLGLALAAAGTLVIGLADASASTSALGGDVLALIGAVAMALILLVIRRQQAELEAVSFSSIAALTGAAVLALVLVLRGLAMGVWPDVPSLESLAWVGATAVVSQLIGHTALTWATQRTTPTIVGLATTAEPVIAAVVTFLWLAETPSTLVIVGSAITLLGVIVGMTGRARAHPAEGAQRSTTKRRSSDSNESVL